MIKITVAFVLVWITRVIVAIVVGTISYLAYLEAPKILYLGIAVLMMVAWAILYFQSVDAIKDYKRKKRLHNANDKA